MDSSLLEHFEREVWSKVPHLEEKSGESKVVNPTPLIDITEDLKQCARIEYGLDLADKICRFLVSLIQTCLQAQSK
jgi:cysteine synthase A